MTLPHPTTGRPRLTIATVATDTPMGAQAYQEQIATRAADALASVDPRTWRVRRIVARGVRSHLPGDLRLPLERIARASSGQRRAIGRMLFRGDRVTHRMSLELPPAAHDVITIHDVVAWRFADESAPVPAAAEEARRAAAVICVSEFSAREAAELLGVRNPHVVYNGVDPRFLEASALDPTSRRELGLPERYILHAGGATRRKNLEGLAIAWPAVHRERPELELVLAGPSHPRRTELFDGMTGVRIVGRLPDEVMPGLVASAEVVVVPSLYEGFGLPALEAMAAGVPVVAAATSSLPEVVGAAGFLVAPDGPSIAAGLIDATSGSSLEAMIAAGRERARQFTWERSAEGHARVWASVA